MESSFRLAKLKAHLKTNFNEKSNTEDQIFKPQSNKKWTSNKNHHTIETYIEVRERGIIRGYQ